MPEPPAYDPATQVCNAYTDINGDITYEVLDMPQEDIDDNEDRGSLETFQAQPGGEVTLPGAVAALKSLIRILYRMTKVD